MLVSVVLATYIRALVSASSLINIERLLQTLIGLVVRVQDILQFLLFQVVCGCGSVVARRRVRALDGLKHADGLVLGRPQIIERSYLGA